VLGRLRELPPELRNAGIAAAALVLTMLLPWYEQSYVPEGSREFVQRNVSAFGVFTFVGGGGGGGGGGPPARGGGV
jgi:hypothetical protein